MLTGYMAHLCIHFSQQTGSLNGLLEVRMKDVKIRYEQFLSDEDRVDPNLDKDPVAFHPVFVFEKVASFWG